MVVIRIMPGYRFIFWFVLVLGQRKKRGNEMNYFVFTIIYVQVVIVMTVISIGVYNLKREKLWKLWKK